MQQLILILAEGGGIGCAFCCLLIATFARNAAALRYGLYVLGFLALLAQGGCWAVMTKLDAIDPGPDFDSYAARLRRIFLVAGGVAFLWALVLEWIALRRWKRSQLENAEQAD